MPNILIEKIVMVPMRDGVKLAPDVHRLEGPASAPAFAAREPYKKEYAAGGRRTVQSTAGIRRVSNRSTTRRRDPR